MNVPMTLILLGASFARMKIPRPFSKIPLPALFWVSFCKLALLRIIGILLTRELTHRGVVPKEALVEVGSIFLLPRSLSIFYRAAFCCYAFERNSVSCEVSSFFDGAMRSDADRPFVIVN